MGSKKRRLERERLKNIERENKGLLERMDSALRSSGRVDNGNDYQIKSLNTDKRQRELQRVARENDVNSKRIDSKKSTINNLNAKKEWKASQQLASNISKYQRWHKEHKNKKTK